MTWNYRIVDHSSRKEKCFGLHEVYYDNNGDVKAWSQALITSDTADFSFFIEKLQEAVKKKVMKIEPLSAETERLTLR